ncbi:Rrf2 family transcriptional regulator [Chryseobacterium nematophagum]|uniref:Rrf2 family transcriptional regulator n=1 Tax=Chryseobacterium nematophagum TaxID=2305228 RepID=A0A3M7LAH9_9FLAO|nr:Rrf2 family transcriptional regulator [Chryseobacterium nematophagum]RMZ59045.1 Rrf2 family transcriptional regulator [Chryseobacterium nematophagum]
MNNTRFATAVHIMTLLAKSPQDWLNSEWIAGSININPVIVRKEISVLREVGLIVCKQGKEGGSQLSRNADSITISEIYSAVKNTDVLGKKNQSPNPICEIGKEINHHLNNLFRETDILVENFLGNKTLKEFTDQF